MKFPAPRQERVVKKGEFERGSWGGLALINARRRKEGKGRHSQGTEEEGRGGDVLLATRPLYAYTPSGGHPPYRRVGQTTTNQSRVSTAVTYQYQRDPGDSLLAVELGQLGQLIPRETAGNSLVIPRESDL